MGNLRLGLNIDHVATLRNARGGMHPDVVRAAHAVARGGADLITIHLREDRRHIRDADIEKLRAESPLPLNLEMAATEEMLAIALKTKPKAVCLVPEKRAELTTEGGLDAAGLKELLVRIIGPLNDAGIEVALFIDPAAAQLEAAAVLKVKAVELHTGTFCHETQNPAHLRALEHAAKRAKTLGLACHAGHGLSYVTVAAVAAIPEMEELNIGHFLVGEAVFMGLEAATRRMRKLIDQVAASRAA